MIVLASFWWTTLINLVLLLIALFLILVVLIQRGKGGGLAEAFGAAGGSSAFGSRAGDAFTKFTIIVASIWLLLIMFTIKLVQPLPKKMQAPDLNLVTPGTEKPAEGKEGS